MGLDVSRTQRIQAVNRPESGAFLAGVGNHPFGLHRLPEIQPPKKEDEKPGQHQGEFHRGGPLWSPPNLLPPSAPPRMRGGPPKVSALVHPRHGAEEGQG